MYTLRNCVWEITLACCFSCRHCGSSGGKARPDELTREECLDVADQLADLGCQRVSLIGGEVFIRSDWDQIAERLITKGVRTAIITNGFQMSEALVTRIREIGIESVAVSLDGMQEHHDQLRQPGSFARAEAAIDRLSQSGIPVSVITTLNHENVSDLEDMYVYLKGYPIVAWQIQACSPMGNAAKGGIDYRFDFGTVIDFVSEHARHAPFALGIADNIGYFTEDEGSLRGNLSGAAVFKGCRAGINGIGIDSVGNVKGCEALYDDCFMEGNLRQRSLREIWEDSNAFAYNRKMTWENLHGKCAECPDNWLCRGGCRSYNYFVHGDLYESPFCARDRHGMQSEAAIFPMRNGY